MLVWRTVCVLCALVIAVLVGSGCAAHQRSRPAEDTRIERPAVPLSEEESLSDKIGEVGVVVLIAVVTVGGILLPILLLGAL
jgi:hypothetical protein